MAHLFTAFLQESNLFPTTPGPHARHLLNVCLQLSLQHRAVCLELTVSSLTATQPPTQGQNLLAKFLLFLFRVSRLHLQSLSVRLGLFCLVLSLNQQLLQLFAKGQISHIYRYRIRLATMEYMYPLVFCLLLLKLF